MAGPKFITFYSVKGGQGKTTLAVQYALRRGLNFITNDAASGSEQIYGKKLPKGKFQISLPGQASVDVDEENPNVLDLGGFVDGRTPLFFQNSAAVVIPVKTSQADMVGFFNSLRHVEKYNRNIIAVVNNDEEKIVGKARDEIAAALGGRYEVFSVRNSVFIEKFVLEDIDIFEMREFGFVQKSLDSLKRQLADLFEGIDRLAKIHRQGGPQ